MMSKERRSRSQMIALLALAFAAGAAVGIAADRWMARTSAVGTKIIGDMSGVLDDLALTPHQRMRAEAILEASAPRAEEAMREAAWKLHIVADSVDAELRAILTPQQQGRLDELRQQPVFMIKRKTSGRGMTTDTIRLGQPER